MDAATSLTRQVRLGTADVPDLTDAITAAAVLPVRRVLRRRRLMRVALLVVGLVQLGIACVALAGMSIGMSMSEHAVHEDAAWNLAIGVAFLATAMAPRRAAGLVPLLGTFIVALAVLCVHDVIVGVVTADRLLTHVAAVVGLGLLLALDRTERALPADRVAVSRSDDEPGSGSLRTVA